MKTRAITGFFFIAVLIAAVLLGAEVFLVFFSALAALSVSEFYTMVRSASIKPLKGLGIAAILSGCALLACYFLGWMPLAYATACLPFFSLIFILPLFQKQVLPFHDIAYTILGICYAGMPFVVFLSLGFVGGTFNGYIPLGFLILLWSSDTGAYLAGKSFGKHKLFERISPNKTWEGFIGGSLFALGVSLVLAHYFGTLETWQWLVVALLIAVFGSLGDLVESMLKRSLGVKDSGHILPGHGGILDRFDGLLLAVPLVYLFLVFTL